MLCFFQQSGGALLHDPPKGAAEALGGGVAQQLADLGDAFALQQML